MRMDKSFMTQPESEFICPTCKKQCFNLQNWRRHQESTMICFFLGNKAMCEGLPASRFRCTDCLGPASRKDNHKRHRKQHLECVAEYPSYEDMWDEGGDLGERRCLP